MNPGKVGIIGSGIGGIASAIRLADKGCQVHVFEKNKEPGGKIASFKTNGFRFDMGPSLFTMPHYVDELFRIAGKDPAEHFKYDKLPLSCRYFFEDGTIISAWSDPERFAEEIESQTGVKANIVQKYLLENASRFNLIRDIFLFRSLHRFRNYLSRGYLKAYPHLLRLDAFMTMHGRNAQRFRNDRVVQLFDRYATYVGSDPYRAPATLNMISHLEHNIGAFFPENGMVHIIQSLKDLAEEMGVVFHFDAVVERVLYDKRIKGLQVNGERTGFDHVVSNSDVNYSNSRLLGIRLPKPGAGRMSSSALIFFWGINRTFQELDLHNILFSSDYRNEFEHIFDLSDMCDDPTIYIFISSKQIRGDAPDGCENWFVMVNVPTFNGSDWKEKIQQARSAVIRKINRHLNVHIEQHILFEEILDPQGIEKRTFSFKGALYGINSNSRFAAFNRHPNFMRKIRGLYFVGGSVHPGGGIPLCLASAKIVSNEFRP